MKNSAKILTRKHQTCWGVDRYVSDEISNTINLKILDFDWLAGFGEYRDFGNNHFSPRQSGLSFVWQRRAIVC